MRQRQKECLLDFSTVKSQIQEIVDKNNKAAVQVTGKAIFDYFDGQYRNIKDSNLPTVRWLIIFASTEYYNPSKGRFKLRGVDEDLYYLRHRQGSGQIYTSFPRIALFVPVVDEPLQNPSFMDRELIKNTLDNLKSTWSSRKNLIVENGLVVNDFGQAELISDKLNFLNRSIVFQDKWPYFQVDNFWGRPQNADLYVNTTGGLKIFDYQIGYYRIFTF